MPRAPIAAAAAPRSRPLRALRAALVLVGANLIIVIIGVFDAIARSDSRGQDTASGFGILAGLVIFSWLATRVSYRWFDCFFLLIPVYGFFWSLKIAWRVASLPYRDWEPRADKVSSAKKRTRKRGTSTPAKGSSIPAEGSAIGRTPLTDRATVQIDGGQIIFRRSSDGNVTTTAKGLGEHPSASTVARARTALASRQSARGQTPWF